MQVEYADARVGRERRRGPLPNAEPRARDARAAGGGARRLPGDARGARAGRSAYSARALGSRGLSARAAALESRYVYCTLL